MNDDVVHKIHKMESETANIVLNLLQVVFKKFLNL